MRGRCPLRRSTAVARYEAQKSRDRRPFQAIARRCARDQRQCRHDCHPKCATSASPVTCIRFGPGQLPAYPATFVQPSQPLSGFRPSPPSVREAPEVAMHAHALVAGPARQIGPGSTAQSQQRPVSPGRDRRQGRTEQCPPWRLRCRGHDVQWPAVASDVERGAAHERLSSSSVELAACATCRSAQSGPASASRANSPDRFAASASDGPEVSTTCRRASRPRARRRLRRSVRAASAGTGCPR